MDIYLKTKARYSLSIKVMIIYVLLASFNTVFFISIIFENQVDLITDNATLKAEKLVNSLVYNMELKAGPVFQEKKSRSEMINSITGIISPIVKKYVLFSESGEKLYSSGASLQFPENHVQNVKRALAGKEFTGKQYHLVVDEKSEMMHFYIPLKAESSMNFLVYLPFNLQKVGNRLNQLYRQGTLVFVVSIIFHLVFALILFKVIVNPIQQLNNGSLKLSEGDLSYRVPVIRNDELGSLAQSFNLMADSIQDKMDTLEVQMNTINEARKKMEEMATTDELTGLYNRRFMFRMLDEELSRSIRKGYNLSFIMIDIDHFKRFNDTHGHQVGDLLLKETAEEIKKTCRVIDVVSRYGGEEIAVIAPDCPVDALKEFCERIRRAVENNKISTSEGDLSVTVSIGATSFDMVLLNAIGDSNRLILFADVALYRAKERGRNRVELG
jgi:diguanylate cyclase (GGDEF)-like protein